MPASSIPWRIHAFSIDFDWVVREACSHEVASAGFWPGAGMGEAAFSAYPEPAGYSSRPVRFGPASYSDTLKEFILPCAAVGDASDPDENLLQFLQTPYAAEANPAHWDRAGLERSESEK